MAWILLFLCLMNHLSPDQWTLTYQKKLNLIFCATILWYNLPFLYLSKTIWPLRPTKQNVAEWAKFSCFPFLCFNSIIDFPAQFQSFPLSRMVGQSLKDNWQLSKLHFSRRENICLGENWYNWRGSVYISKQLWQLTFIMEAPLSWW